MINVSTLFQIHADTVDRWHRHSIDNPYVGIYQTICQQHSFNFRLWHEEDIARSQDVSDAEIARVKRSIDSYNQQRNDWIEKVDDDITQILEDQNLEPAPDARMNTETPGCTIDRLSILALRLYHLDEQLERTDVDDQHLEAVEHKIAVCRLQRDELGQSLNELLEDIFSGRKRHRTYRQFKMYNDPNLNPYLYSSARKSA